MSASWSVGDLACRRYVHEAPVQRGIVPKRMNGSSSFLTGGFHTFVFSSTVLKGHASITKIKSTSFWNFATNSGIRKISQQRKCYQLGSSYDGRQFVTLSVHLCVQHDMCDVMCRAGSSATAEICSVTPDGSLEDRRRLIGLDSREDGPNLASFNAYLICPVLSDRPI